jgi:hypothetical protein
MTPVPPRNLEAVLSAVRAGARLLVPTETRCTVIDSRCLARWEKVGEWLLREDGDGYRMRTGKRSVYLLPGQLQIEPSSNA